MKRKFMDAPSEFRCRWTITLKDKSQAQCGRRKTHDHLCEQHSKILNKMQKCEYCGGNDEYPPDHTMDCSNPNR